MAFKIHLLRSDNQRLPADELISKDELTKATIMIEHFHHETHDGHAFTANRTVTHGAVASPNILIVTPNSSVRAHFFLQAVSDAPMTLTLYEEADYAGGTSLPSYNRDRNNKMESKLTLTYDAADSGGGKGTAIWVFSGGANKEVVMSNREHMEFILIQNTKYLIETVGANGDIITILTDWYEHEET